MRLKNVATLVIFPRIIFVRLGTNHNRHVSEAVLLNFRT